VSAGAGRLIAFRRKSAEPRGDFVSHRIYLWDRHGVCGRLEIEAEDDQAALDSAEIITEVCADFCQAFEVWSKAAPVGHGEPLVPVSTAATSERRGMLVAQLRDTLKETRRSFAVSPKLREALEAFVTQRGPETDPSWRAPPSTTGSLASSETN
jgi:hypothetical protein